MLAFEVGALWRTPPDELSFSGTITLPYPLPQGVSLRAILIPQPLRRSPKEKFILHLEMPIPEPAPEKWPDDLNYKGEIMSQWFRPPKPSNRRHKILIWGPSGSAKTKSALEFPNCAYIDNHGSAEKYEAAYPQHLFFGSAAEPPTPDNTMAAVTFLLGDPGDRRTLALDDITTYWDQIQGKWSKLFLSRLPKSPGHHAEFYTLQPSDWQHPKRELRSLIRRMIALDMNVVVIARAQKEYAGEGTNFMNVIGETFAGEKNLVYEFDYVFQFAHILPTAEDTTAGKSSNRYLAIVHKQRITPGEKPLPDSCEFHIDKKGRSTFYDEFSKFVDKDRLNQEAHGVADPVKEGETVAAEPGPEQGPEPKQAGITGEAIAPKPEPENAALKEAMTAQAEMVTADQLDKLVKLKAHFKIEKPEWDSLLTKFYGVTTARALSKDQAEAFITHIEKVRVPF